MEKSKLQAVFLQMVFSSTLRVKHLYITNLHLIEKKSQLGVDFCEYLSIIENEKVKGDCPNASTI